MGPVTIMRTPTDIFPNIDIPVVSIVWQYSGLSADQMANRIVTLTERSLSTTVNNIEHVESQSLNGIGVVKVFFQPHSDISTAIAQITAVSQTQLKQLPSGTSPPLIIVYNASSVPIIQLALSGQGLSEQELNDLGQNFLRPQLITVAGAAIPYSYGGKQRQVQVDLNTQALQARGLAPSDVTTAIGNQNLILPSGTTKIGQFENNVEINGSPTSVEDLNNLPIKVVNGSTIFIRDVAHVRDGFPPQTNIVRSDGQRGSLMSVLKSGNTSTLDIVKGIHNLLPQIQATVPASLRITPIGDQSIFVRASINGVVREAIIAACLTAIMILVFLGSWRSTIIIAISIPLSILCSIITLSALGETINIMTLGGLALAVGILVDDATVTIENIERYLEEGQGVEEAILNGSAQIAVPAFVSTLSICIVFVPMFFLSGVARYLFVPLAEAVVFAMIASYALSRTVVPTMAKYLLKVHDQHDKESAQQRNPFVRIQLAFERGFERMRNGYHDLLKRTVAHPVLFTICFFAACLASFALFPWLGQNFFPSVDSGQFKLHMRAQTGTRIEETARLCDLVEHSIREEIPQSELTNILDNIGLPYSGINTSYSNSAAIGPADADIQVSLAEKHKPTDEYIRTLRAKLAKQFPGLTFYFLPADIVSQILNFGLPAPIDIQIVGRDVEGNRQYANKLFNEIKYVPGITDLRVQQPFNAPKLQVDIDRTKSQEAGYTARDVATNLLVALSGSFQTSPTFWLNPKTGVSYNVAIQTPQYQTDTLQGLGNLPISNSRGTPPQILNSLAAIYPGQEQATVSHYNVQPVLDLYGSVQGRDLGGVSKDIDRILSQTKNDLPRGTRVVVRGQVQTMKASFIGLLGGLIFSILLVYLLIVINFQSWIDPFVIIAALPAALAGIVWFLFLTHTTLSVPALTGSIMCMGVATANSVLVVSFAKEQMEAQVNATEAALAAGFTRFRPVLMTALAMIIGMVPMALGLGEGGEQNAPLGRAVIGGLLLATLSTLFFVPTFLSLVHAKDKPRLAEFND
jgi:multidrug efflux pump subunit AcrB